MTERKCQGCNTKKDRSEMIRITKLADCLKINPNSKELGRSIYVCKNPECIKALIKKKRIKQGLKYSKIEEIKKTEQELLNMI